MKAIPKGILLLIVTLILSVSIHGQEDQKKDGNEFRKEFEAFKSGIEKDFKAFKDRNDSIFITFLQGAWKEYELFVTEKEIRPKPLEQPVWDGENESHGEIPLQEKELEKEEQQPPRSQGSAPKAGRAEEAVVFPSAPMPFFGAMVDVPLASCNQEPMSSPTSQRVTEFFDYLASDIITRKSIAINNDIADKRKLNGWGTFQLLEQLSGKYYADRNRRCLFIWYALLKLGIDARIGLNDEDICLFAHTDSEVFNNRFMLVNGRKYYLFTLGDDSPSIERIQTYEADYPASLAPLSLKLSMAPELGSDTFERKLDYEGGQISLLADLSLLDFYATYPDCRLEVYFSAPLSVKALDAFDRALGEGFSALDKTGKVNRLLNLLQYAFPYRLDEQQFGREKYMFAEEAIFYPYSDCEDRAVLLSRLIKHYTGLPVIGLDYPGHVAIGVALDKDIQGDFVYWEGKRYYVCDPSYVGAGLGFVMNETKGIQPGLIQINY